MGEEFARDVGEFILGVAGVGQGQEQMSSQVVGGEGVAQKEREPADEATKSQDTVGSDDPENVKSRL